MILTESDFQKEVLDSTKVVLVDFWAPWCQPCNMMTPVMEALEKDGYSIGKVNIDEERELADKYGINSIPAFVFFKDGEVKHTKFGACSKESLIEEIEKL